MLTIIDADGKIKIPQELVRALGVKPNDRLSIALEDGTLRIRRVELPPDSSYFWVPAREAWLSWHEMRQIAWDERAQEIADEGSESDGG
jgi:bifunctional DNA-binding transcriptional regulator/antitoxin component of YhaV-PrlF toxin-antitoxin module